MIYSKILCDSVSSATGIRLTTMVCEYPLMIHNELLTHRSISKNSASSRAIPIAKRLQRVLDDPMIPTVWPKNEPGMSATVNLEGVAATDCETAWRAAAAIAVNSAKTVAETGLHKQVCNRIVEPFCWMTTLLSATDWENFFALRCAKDAHPDLQELAYWMLHALMQSSPKQLEIGEWHVPFGDKMAMLVASTPSNSKEASVRSVPLSVNDRLKVATARCARISYLTQDGEIDIAKDIELHDRLLASKHMSPFEHCAQASIAGYYGGNFRGWLQYRKTIAGETRSCNLNELFLELNRERRALGKRLEAIA